ncbi:hypothetical protein TNCV_4543111 [Trichonephila clavipes]|nr:hypothetical protein TNCV_4543111 [Trichonephila clavipes]
MYEGESENKFPLSTVVRVVYKSQNIEAFQTEEAFKGLFDFSVASKVPSDSSTKPESHLLRDQDMADGVGAPN